MHTHLNANPMVGMLGAHALKGKNRLLILQALVWFWIIDETYVLTFVMSCDMS